MMRVKRQPSRVLLVEDEELWRLSTSAVLENAGYEVASAASAADARSTFASFNPDAVVLDINLPDGDGVELLREFMRAKPRLVGIMLTGYATMQKALTARSLGSVDIIEKMGGNTDDPGLADDLLASLKKHL
jgi:DNA-binding NtrC family response regulator